MNQTEPFHYVWAEYALNLRPSELAALIANPRVRAAESKSHCSVHFTRRVLNKRQKFSGWARYSIIRITGPDDQSIAQCNRLLEQAIPGYQWRKEYSRRAPITVYSKNVEAEGDLRSRISNAVNVKAKRGMSEIDMARSVADGMLASRSRSAKSHRDIESPFTAISSEAMDMSAQVVSSGYLEKYSSLLPLRSRNLSPPRADITGISLTSDPSKARIVAAFSHSSDARSSPLTTVKKSSLSHTQFPSRVQVDVKLTGKPVVHNGLKTQNVSIVSGIGSEGSYALDAMIKQSSDSQLALSSYDTHRSEKSSSTTRREKDKTTASSVPTAMSRVPGSKTNQHPPGSTGTSHSLSAKYAPTVPVKQALSLATEDQNSSKMVTDPSSMPGLSMNINLTQDIFSSTDEELLNKLTAQTSSDSLAHLDPVQSPTTLNPISDSGGNSAPSVISISAGASIRSTTLNNAVAKYASEHSQLVNEVKAITCVSENRLSSTVHFSTSVNSRPDGCISSDVFTVVSFRIPQKPSLSDRDHLVATSGSQSAKALWTKELSFHIADTRPGVSTTQAHAAINIEISPSDDHTIQQHSATDVIRLLPADTNAAEENSAVIDAQMSPMSGGTTTTFGASKINPTSSTVKHAQLTMSSPSLNLLKGSPPDDDVPHLSIGLLDSEKPGQVVSVGVTATFASASSTHSVVSENRACSHSNECKIEVQTTVQSVIYGDDFRELSNLAADQVLNETFLLDSSAVASPPSEKVPVQASSTHQSVDQICGSPLSISASVSTNLEALLNRGGKIDLHLELTGSPIPDDDSEGSLPPYGPSLSTEWNVKLEHNISFGPIGVVSSPVASCSSRADTSTNGKRSVA